MSDDELRLAARPVSTATASTPSHRPAIPGVELVIRHRGSGPVLVLLPGLGAGWDVWESVVDELVDGFEVIAVNLPGLGSAPLPAGRALDVETLTDAIESWLQERGVERPHVAGHGLGGAIALELAKRDRVASVCALAPIGFETEWQSRLAAARLSVGFRVGGRVSLWLARLPRPRRLRALLLALYSARAGRRIGDRARRTSRRYLSASVLERALPAIGRYRFISRLAPTVPVTVAWGTRARLLNFGQARRALQIIPGARLVWLRRCGRMPMREDPQLVALMIATATASGLARTSSS